MLLWIIKISIISIIFIIAVHHLLVFFKTTLTVPKIKDLVNSPNKKYQHIFDTLLHKKTDYSDIHLLPTENEIPSSNNMKHELKSFLKSKLNNDMSNDVVGLDSSIGSYSNLF